MVKPISLHGHEKSITQVCYNREGDLLFSCAKDKNPNVWYSINGERLGTYDGHGGAVWCLDVDWQTKYFLSGAADNTIRLWDVENGILLNKIETKSAVRTCKFAYSGNMVAFTTDKNMGQPCNIHIADLRTFGSEQPMITIPIPQKGPKVTSLIWGSLDEKLCTGHENGDIVQWDVKEHQKVNIVSDHAKSISDMQLSPDRSMFISASKDNTAKLFDTDSLDCLKTYKTDRPVNSASISPIYEHVVLGGGQEAMDVTTTSTKIGKFDARFFHMVYENEEFSRLKGHFGPINSVQFHPDGMSYASGGEDGYVRINTFDKAYHDFKFEA
jgi:translation initiation factor 3 subunit I